MKHLLFYRWPNIARMYNKRAGDKYTTVEY